MAGGTVIITATLGSGYTWDSAAVAGWTFAGSTATLTVQLDDPECTPVSSVAPIVTQAVCDLGVVSRPGATLPATSAGITYTKSGEEVAGGTVTVTATLNDGFAWASTDLEGWEFTSPTTATFIAQLDDPDCSSQITPGDGTGKTPQDTPFRGSLLTLVDNPNGDLLVFGPGELPKYGSVVIEANGTYVYTPDPGFCGTDTFTYTVKTPESAPVTGTVTIEVTCDPSVTVTPGTTKTPETPAATATKTPVRVTILPSTGQGGSTSNLPVFGWMLVLASTLHGAAAVTIVRRTRS